MVLSRFDGLFNIKGAKTVSKQRISLWPVEHHYENKGEEEYIKYGCQLCEDIARSYPNDLMGKDEQFVRFSFPKGTKRCPCCGVYINWDYRETGAKL